MKLVLFDIDGTLIRHIESNTHSGWDRFEFALKEVYGVDVKHDVRNDWNGSVDREIMYQALKPYGITQKEFTDKFPQAAAKLYQYAITIESSGKQLYKAIPEAVQLARNLSKQQNITVGLLTGNVRKMALWKIVHAGIDPALFSFGVFADDFDDRISMAKSVFDQTGSELGIAVNPSDIYIIGDAIRDARCARAIGAHCILVTTGYHSEKYVLEKETPDILVDTLSDRRVLKFILYADSSQSHHPGH